jgi:hypothetical protein
MAQFGLVTVGDEIAALVANGRVLDRATLGVPAQGTGPWPLCDAEGRLLAVYEAHKADTAKPAVVIPR